MKRVGAPLKVLPPRLRALFDPVLTERAWIVEECAFDYSVLREKLRGELERAGIPVRSVIAWKRPRPVGTERSRG